MSEYIEERQGKKGTSYKVSLVYYDHGDRKKYSKTFASWDYGSKAKALKEATIHRDLMKAKLLKNEPINNSNKTLSEVYELKQKTFVLAPETNRHHDIIMSRYIYPVIHQKTKFSEITYLDIIRVLDRAKTLVTQDYLNRIFSVFKELYKSAIINNVVSIDQTIKVIVPRSTKTPKHRKREVNQEEIDELIEKLKSMRSKKAELIELAIQIMRYTGIRTSELLALSKEDFDLENKTLMISKGIRYDENRQAYTATPKTNSSQRLIPIDDNLVDLIKTRPSGSLFTLNGRIITTGEIADVLRRVSDGFTLYQLRHQFATDLVKIADLGTVQSLMGHSSPSTTIGYVQTNFEDMKKALKRRNI